MRRVFVISVAVLACTLAGTAQVPGAIRQLPCCGISTASGSTATTFVGGSQVGFRGGVTFGRNPQVNIEIGASRGHHFRGGAVYGGYYPYYPYYGYVPTYTEPAPQPQPEAESNDTTEPPGFTVFERRKEYQLAKTEDRGDRYGEHRFAEKSDGAAPSDDLLEPHAQAAARAAAKAPANEPSAAEERENVVTILVYRDGHQRELHDYAIIGGAVYDLSRHPGQGPNKILLAELDLDATVRLNQNSGVEFNLPKR